MRHLLLAATLILPSGFFAEVGGCVSAPEFSDELPPGTIPAGFVPDPACVSFYRDLIAQADRDLRETLLVTGRVALVRTDAAIVFVQLTPDPAPEKPVPVGMRLTVFRRDEFIGKVEVVRGRPGETWAYVLFLGKGCEIRAGDQFASRLD